MDVASACSPLPFPLVQGGILVQYRNTSAASGSKKASYVEKGKAQGEQEYEGQISNSSNCKGKSPTSGNCKGKNPILPKIFCLHRFMLIEIAHYRHMKGRKVDESYPKS